MAERREEKYIISYPEYSIISNRVRSVLLPDPHGNNGRYSICSMYFDDPVDTALYEKEDGQPIHIKYRIRTYNGDRSFISLERKTKRGIVTEKSAVAINETDLEKIKRSVSPNQVSRCFDMAADMRTRALSPKVCVRYDREAYYQPTTGVRVTFDMNIDALSPDTECLFGDCRRVIPSFPRDKVIMEIKYGEKCPSFIRICCASDGMQLSVSKYALCRGTSVL